MLNLAIGFDLALQFDELLRAFIDFAQDLQSHRTRAVHIDDRREEGMVHGAIGCVGCEHAITAGHLADGGRSPGDEELAITATA